MFFFGDPSDTAQLYWEQALSITGPLLPAVHYEEMDNEQDLKNCLTYLRIAAESAMREDAPDEVVDLLISSYDEVFAHMAKTVDSFYNAIKQNRHQYLGGYDTENVEKYRKLAGIL